MITRFLFERWWLLCAVLVVVELILFAVWTRRRTALAGRAAWIGLVAAIVLPITSHLVVTQRERIERLCRSAAQMIDIGDVASLGGLLADDFEVAGLDKEAFLARVAKTLTRYRVDHPSLRRIKVTLMEAGRADAVFDAVCSIRSTETNFDRLFSRWRITLVWYDSNWRIVTVEALPSPFSPIRNVRDWLR